MRKDERERKKKEGIMWFLQNRGDAVEVVLIIRREL